MAISRAGASLPDGSPTVAVDLAQSTPDDLLLRDVEVVFHLAGIAHRQAEASAYQRVNNEATVRLARQAAASGVRCFVFLSSVKAMGPPAGGAARSENNCNPPTDAYGLSKWHAECALREEFSHGSMSVVILRPTLIYGAGARGNLRLLATAVRRGLPRPPPDGARSMLSLPDLLKLLCDIAVSPPAGVHTWIACDDRAYSTRYLYDLLREAGGRATGRSWLPRWAWRLGATLLDLRGAGKGDPAWDKLFGTEVYSNSALHAATGWHSSGSLKDAAAAMAAATGDTSG